MNGSYYLNEADTFVSHIPTFMLVWSSPLLSLYTDNIRYYTWSDNDNLLRLLVPNMAGILSFSLLFSLIMCGYWLIVVDVYWERAIKFTDSCDVKAELKVVSTWVENGNVKNQYVPFLSLITNNYIIIIIIICLFYLPLYFLDTPSPSPTMAPLLSPLLRSPSLLPSPPHGTLFVRETLISTPSPSLKVISLYNIWFNSGQITNY